MKYPIKFSGILLAGGKSSRMGQDKAFMKFGEKFLFEFSLSVLKNFSEDILISSSDQRFDIQGIIRVEDEMPGLGPISGLYTCLPKIKNKSAIILACDLPLISAEVIETLIRNSEGYEITIALNHLDLPEPLIGIYSSSIIPSLENMIKMKNYKLQDLVKTAKTNLIKIPNVSDEIFQNINNQSDYNSLLEEGILF